MTNQTTLQLLQSGETSLGLEFGSTRIKAVLISHDGTVLASGGHDWHDELSNGVWTYSMEAVREGLQDCYLKLKADVLAKYGVKLQKIGSMGMSAMMHGYLAFDDQMNLLVPFRTWRNTITGPAAAELTSLFQFNIPQRWSIAHLHQAILNQEEHVGKIAFITTLAGYATYLLTGEKVIGVGDAAGMFPIDSNTLNYDERMLALYEEHIKPCGYAWNIREILPKVLLAGDKAGVLTAEGAKVLDPEGDLQPGSLVCPPEGDAGTGMTATNAVAVRTGNVSAGTSVFAMIVLEKALSRLHTEIDMVTTPTGLPVAMVHCNTCTSDINAWASLFRDFANAAGMQLTNDQLYTLLFKSALSGEKDGGQLTAFNYYSGEPITGTDAGVPLFTRRPDAPMTLPNFMRVQIYSALATLAIGMKILTEDEKVAIDKVLGHGGLFKTPVVGQSILAAAIHSPVTVLGTASEGGPWGMALLAAFMATKSNGEALETWLNDRVFSEMPSETLNPDPADVAGFDAYLSRYTACLEAEKAATKALM